MNVIEDLIVRNDDYDYYTTYNSLSLYTWNGLNGWNSFGNDFYNLFVNAGKSNYEELKRSFKSSLKDSDQSAILVKSKSSLNNSGFSFNIS